MFHTDALFLRPIRSFSFYIPEIRSFECSRFAIICENGLFAPANPNVSRSGAALTETASSRHQSYRRLEASIPHRPRYPLLACPWVLGDLSPAPFDKGNCSSETTSSSKGTHRSGKYYFTTAIYMDNIRPVRFPQIVNNAKSGADFRCCSRQKIPLQT